jgi:hypothetical protein
MPVVDNLSAVCQDRYAIVPRRTEETLLGVLQLEVLVGELVAVDALAASAVALGEVTTLDHELLDNTVEVGAFVAVALLAGSKGTEVLSGLWESQWLAHGSVEA